jgi:hypothetical protein
VQPVGIVEAVQLSETVVLLDEEPVRPVGTPGAAVQGFVPVVVTDNVLLSVVPLLFVAAISKLYAVPAVKPVTA